MNEQKFNNEEMKTHYVFLSYNMNEVKAMKITQVFCPSCGGKINGDLSKNTVYCPYCGTQLYIDHEKNEITINQHINISKTETKRIIDEKYSEYYKSERIKNITNLILIISLLLFIYFLLH